MDLAFSDSDLEQLCASYAMLRKLVGERCARTAAAHLASLRAASCLDEFRHLPGRCRERRSALVLDMLGDHELVFEPVNQPAPTDTGGKLDWSAVRSIRILAIATSATPRRR